jgi:hypothetical protein
MDPKQALDQCRSDLELTVETLIRMDEPEALLATLQRQAKRKSGERWKALAKILSEAEEQLTLIVSQSCLPLDEAQPDAEAKPE